MTDDESVGGRVEFSDASLQVTKGYVDRARNVTGVPFVLLAYIEHDEVSGDRRWNRVDVSCGHA